MNILGKTYTFYVPVIDGAETKTVKNLYASFGGLLLQHSGGYTVTQGRGAWINPQKQVIFEPVLVYQVALVSPVDTAVTEIVAFIRDKLGQQAVAFTCPNGDFVIVDREEST
jgi:hypothetical protein